MLKNYSLMLVLALVAFLASCGRNEKEASSIEQIYAEEGVPVKVQPMQPQLFVKELSYNATLTGIKESSAHAYVGDQVEKIYVKVGDYVNKDNVLLTFPMDNPNAQYYQAKVAFDNAKQSYERMENLFQKGGISKQQRDNAKTNYEVAKANWDAAQQTVRVRAPISGYVTKVNVRESDYIKRDEELFTISQIDKMKAKVWVTDKEVVEIKKGQPAYAIWNTVRIDGNVVEVDMALNQQKQAFGVDVEFDNPNKILKSVIIVDVFIQTYTNSDALVVRMKDLFKDNEQYYVYVVDEGKAVKRSVKLGLGYKLDSEVIEGLKVGDQLVREGQMLLKDGAKVKIIE